MTAILECEHLTVGYGTVSVARDVTLSISPREILAILGPNGAGKSSLILTLAGVLTPISGTVTLAGEPVKAGSARRLLRLALGISGATPELEPVVVPLATVARIVDIPVRSAEDAAALVGEPVPESTERAAEVLAELAAFLAAVRGNPSSIVRAEEGRAALALALKVTGAVQRLPAPALGR